MYSILEVEKTDGELDARVFMPLASKRFIVRIHGIEVVNIRISVAVRPRHPKPSLLRYRFSGFSERPIANLENGEGPLMESRTAGNYLGLHQIISGSNPEQWIDDQGKTVRFRNRFTLRLKGKMVGHVRLPYLGWVTIRAKVRVNYGLLEYNIWSSVKEKSEAIYSVSEITDADDFDVEFSNADGSSVEPEELAKALGEPGHWESSGLMPVKLPDDKSRQRSAETRKSGAKMERGKKGKRPRGEPGGWESSGR
ncbi:hypothetical protein V7799_31040 [Rhizobium laguerreae]